MFPLLGVAHLVSIRAHTFSVVAFILLKGYLKWCVCGGGVLPLKVFRKHCKAIVFARPIIECRL